jgi:hypothetical protein
MNTNSQGVLTTGIILGRTETMELLYASYAMSSLRSATVTAACWVMATLGHSDEYIHKE